MNTNSCKQMRNLLNAIRQLAESGRGNYWTNAPGLALTADSIRDLTDIIQCVYVDSQKNDTPDDISPAEEAARDAAESEAQA